MPVHITLSHTPSRDLKDSPHFKMLRNLEALENELSVKGRRTEAGCKLIQVTVGSMTEMGL